MLPPEERDERVRLIVSACRDIAMAAGGFPGLFGMGGVISRDEAQLLDALEAELREKIGK